ncbi:MAG: protease modulator HflC [Verrucomicrobiota bacterium]|jgi:membrane protease subunit HflC
MKKKNPLTLLVGTLLLLIFVALLFCFQVRTTEVAVVTTFGKFSRSITEPGLYLRAPLPIQKIYKFDNRLQNFERKFEQTTTKDAKNLLITVFIGWKVSEPKVFLERFNGDTLKAEQSLENLVRNAKNAVIGSYNFGDLISPDPKQVKFDAVEADILKELKASAQTTYGVSVELVGIKQLGLPESITGKVFERMRAERDRLVKQFNGEGEAKSLEIRSDANRKRDELLAKADADSLRILGEAEAAASKDYAVFEQKPDLAVFLLQLKALVGSLKDRTTLVLDEKIPPLNLLNADKPAAK